MLKDLKGNMNTMRKNMESVKMNQMQLITIKISEIGVPMWLSGLRIQCCHCCGLGSCQSLAPELLHAIDTCKQAQPKRKTCVCV